MTPAPTPPIAAATYSIVSESATEFMTQAIATSTPLRPTMTLGPNLSIKYPSNGTSHVSVNTKIVKATWIAALPQWYFWSIGLTNRVQPYCKLAIITMQMMPKISWPQRVNSDARSPASTDPDAAVMSYPCCFCAFLPSHRQPNNRRQEPPAISLHLDLFQSASNTNSILCCRVAQTLCKSSDTMTHTVPCAAAQQSAALRHRLFEGGPNARKVLVSAWNPGLVRRVIAPMASGFAPKLALHCSISSPGCDVGILSAARFRCLSKRRS